jgi:hypothetical protein
LELFGANTLLRPIALHDLTVMELDFLEAGSYQILPGRDRAGRAILLHIRSIERPIALHQQVQCVSREEREG